jgi:hypothetical protein
MCAGIVTIRRHIQISITCDYVLHSGAPDTTLECTHTQPNQPGPQMSRGGLYPGLYKAMAL